MTEHPEQIQPYSSMAIDILTQEQLNAKYHAENLKNTFAEERSTFWYNPIGVFPVDCEPNDRNEPANESATNENVKKVLPFELLPYVLDVGDNSTELDDWPEFSENEFNQTSRSSKKRQKEPKTRKSYIEKLSICQGLTLCVVILIIIFGIAYFNLFASMFVVFCLVLVVLTH